MKARAPLLDTISDDDKIVFDQLVETHGPNKAMEIVLVSLMRAHAEAKCPCQDTEALIRLIEADGLDIDELVAELARFPCESARKNAKHHWEAASNAFKQWRAM